MDGLAIVRSFAFQDFFFLFFQNVFIFFNTLFFNIYKQKIERS